MLNFLKMATSAIGTLTEFNPEEEDVASYVERVELFFEANNIAEEKKVAVFLTAVGKKTYEILRHHSAPKLLRENSFEEIVTLFKQHSISGSDTFQHSSTHHQAKADKPVQEPENASKLSTAQSQTSGEKNNAEVTTDDRKEQGSQNSQEALDEWEPSLTDKEKELAALQELGLGMAIDITAKHPWVTKSAFQAKPVTKEELVVINESNRSQTSREQVETYTSIQQGLESSFRPDPTTPINVTVAADFHRSNSRSKTINSQTVLTRTVAFRAKDPLSRSGDNPKAKGCFETNLHKWLVERNCYPVVCDKHEKLECGIYSETTNHHCIDYLKELGGVTHYVSSITLGATKYQVTLNSTLFTSLSSSSEVTAHTFASATTKSKASKKVFQSNSKEQHIGKIPEGKGDILRFRTKGEAVVKCSYNSLANLVSHPRLRKFLERGINEYIDLKKNGTRGPYHICTAELILVPSKKSGEKNGGEENSDKENDGVKNGGEENSDKENDGVKNGGEENSDKENDGVKNGGEENSDKKNGDENSDNKKRLYWMIDWKESSSDGSGNDKASSSKGSGNDKASSSKGSGNDNASSSNGSGNDNASSSNGSGNDNASSGNGSGNDHRYSIVSTAKEQKASNFYLKPIVHCASDKYFWIVTDPEDHGPRDRKKSEVEPEFLKEQKLPCSDDCKPKSTGTGEHQPQRHVSICKKNLVVELNVTPHTAKRSAFKLKNPRDDQTYPLHQSQWLPEALRGSQPYIIGREGKSFRTRLKKDQVCSVYVKKDGLKFMYGHHKEGHDGYGFFILETGHKT